MSLWSLIISILSALVALGALYWSRRSARAAEKSATVAEKALAFSVKKHSDEQGTKRRQRLDELVKEGISDWNSRGQLKYLIDRQCDLTLDEIRELVQRVFAGLGRSAKDADRYCRVLLEDARQRDA